MSEKTGGQCGDDVEDAEDWPIPEDGDVDAYEIRLVEPEASAHGESHQGHQQDRPSQARRANGHLEAAPHVGAVSVCRLLAFRLTEQQHHRRRQQDGDGADPEGCIVIPLVDQAAHEGTGTLLL